MLNLHLCTRIAGTLGASALIAGSAAAASTSSSNASDSKFLDFFESIFDDDSNGGRRTAANIDTTAIEASLHAVSVLGDPSEGEEVDFGAPVWAANDGGRRVTGGGEEEEQEEERIIPESIEVVDLRPAVIEALVPGECDPTIRRCGVGGGDDGGGAQPVPEPSAGLLFGLGALLVRRHLRA